MIEPVSASIFMVKAIGAFKAAGIAHAAGHTAAAGFAHAAGHTTAFVAGKTAAAGFAHTAGHTTAALVAGKTTTAVVSIAGHHTTAALVCAAGSASITAPTWVFAGMLVAFAAGTSAAMVSLLQLAAKTLATPARPAARPSASGPQSRPRRSAAEPGQPQTAPVAVGVTEDQRQKAEAFLRSMGMGSLADHALAQHDVACRALEKEQDTIHGLEAWGMSARPEH